MTDVASRRSQNSLPLLAATIARYTAGLFVLLLALLHLLRHDLDPSWRVISEYGRGEHGWLMRLAFAAMALACVALVTALRPYLRGVAAILAGACVAATAVGFALAAVFTTDPILATAAERTAAGKLHEAAATLDLLPIAALLLAWRLPRQPGWAGSRRVLVVAAAAMWVAQLAFIATLAATLPKNHGRMGPEVPIGWPNRAVIVAQAAWLIAVGWRVASISGSPLAGPRE